MAEIQLRNISKRWGNVVGVANFDLTIANREFLVLLGPSGCGKTTTMRMVAGLEDPSEGEIIIDGTVVNALEPKDRDIAMVFQSYGLYPNMNVYENIRFPLKVRKVPQDKHHDRVMRAAAMVELQPLLERKPAALSGGQRQRVALARAIVREPNVFLMDEPLSNLDAKLRVSTRAQIKNLQHELQTTTIYVTHDQIEAMTLADRVVVMNKGVVQQIGSPTEIYDRPANTFVAGFIGSPAMNLVNGRIEKGVFHAENMQVSGFQGHADGEAIIGFRAEDAKLATREGKNNHDQSQIIAAVYAFEILGDATMFTVHIGHDLVAIKADKDYRVEIGASVTVDVPRSICHLFDAQSGERIDKSDSAAIS